MHRRPLGLRQRGKEGIAGDVERDSGHQHTIGHRQGIAVDLRAADHEDLAASEAAARVDGVGQPVRDRASRVMPGRISGQYDGVASGQRAADRGEGASPHDQRVPEGGVAEVPQIFRQMPGQRVVAPDHAAVGAGHEQGYRAAREGRFSPRCGAHTATGALMCGCA